MLWIVGLQTAISASSTSSSTLRRVAYLSAQHTDFHFSADAVSILRLATSLLIILLVVRYLRRRRRSTKVDSSDGSM